MTDHERDHEPDAEAPVEDQAPEPRLQEGMATDFSSGEGLVAVAGLLLIVVWLIFEVIAAEYFVSTLGVAAAAGAAIIPRLNQSDVEKIHRRAVIMKVLAYVLVINGVLEIIDDIRFEAYDSIMAVIGALGAYVAYGMAFVGARQIKI